MPSISCFNRAETVSVDVRVLITVLKRYDRALIRCQVATIRTVMLSEKCNCGMSCDETSGYEISIDKREVIAKKTRRQSHYVFANMHLVSGRGYICEVSSEIFPMINDDTVARQC